MRVMDALRTPILTTWYPLWLWRGKGVVVRPDNFKNRRISMRTTRPGTLPGPYSGSRLGALS